MALERLSRSTWCVIIFPQSACVLSTRGGRTRRLLPFRQGRREGGRFPHPYGSPVWVHLSPFPSEATPHSQAPRNPQSWTAQISNSVSPLSQPASPRPCTCSHLNEPAGNGPSQSPASAGYPGGREAPAASGLVDDGFICSRSQKEGEG